MRQFVFASFLALTLLAVSACGGENKSAATSPPAEMQQYAKAMDGWWREVTGAEVPTAPFLVHMGLDSERIQRAPPKLVPSMDVPSAIRTQHDLLLVSIEGWATAKGLAEFAGRQVGLAAYFCNIRSSGVDSFYWRRVEALQAWRDTNRPCREGATWGGNWPLGEPFPPKTDLSPYQMGCGAGIHDLDDFGSAFSVSTFDLGEACANRDRWRVALDDAAQIWAAELTFLCSGQRPTDRVSPADAIASCSKAAK